MDYRLTSTGLKWVAIITMIIDHIGATLLPASEYPNMIVLRMIGRLAFPIFAFLIVEGYRHTKNIKLYGTRLLIFAIISEVPFDLAFRGSTVNMDYQNVFFTLALGLLAIHCYDRFKETNGLLAGGVIYLVGLLAEFIRSDYGIFGVMLICLLYVFRDKTYMAISIVVINLLFVVTGASWYQVFGILSLVFIYMYNGKPGRRMKYLFYIIYPGHIMVLYLLDRFVF